MGYNNKNNNSNKKKKRPNYFDIKYQQGGEHFITRMTTMDIKKDAGKILKDMAYANIDYTADKYLRFFTDPGFINILLQSCYENWNYNNTVCIGLETFFASSGQQASSEMTQVYNVHNMARIAYNILYDGLTTVSNYLVGLNNGMANVGPGPIIDTLFIMTQKVIQYNKGMNYTFIVVNNNPGNRGNNNDERTRNQNKGNVQRTATFSNSR